jgi:hypothetical protein
MDPVDVRSPSEVEGLERLLEKGPLTIVLIYADWCGACHRFRENTWKEVSKMPSRTMNIGAVREDMLANTSLQNAKISHYPSLLLVGTDKKPAEFVSPTGEVTNAIPNNDSQAIKEILKTPVPKLMEPEPAMVNVALKNNLPLSKTPEKPLESMLTGPLAEEVRSASLARPPTLTEDLKENIQNATAAANTPPPRVPVGGGARRGLLEALAQVAKNAGPAAIFVTAAHAMRKRGKTQRHRTRRSVKARKTAKK